MNEKTPLPTMALPDLVDSLEFLDEAGIEIWLDGGWGVDALLHEQTRIHRDVDIIVRVSDVLKMREQLKLRGFALKEGSPPNSFVLADGAGLEIDVHAVRFDADGNGIYRMENGEDWIYPAGGFGGVGLVGDLPVQCLTPEVQVLCHAHGYVPVEKDFQDMEHLRRQFGVEIPAHLKSPTKEAK